MCVRLTTLLLLNESRVSHKRELTFTMSLLAALCSLTNNSITIISVARCSLQEER